jgi:hypothetical protein
VRDVRGDRAPRRGTAGSGTDPAAQYAPQCAATGSADTAATGPAHDPSARGAGLGRSVRPVRPGRCRHPSTAGRVPDDHGAAATTLNHVTPRTVCNPCQRRGAAQNGPHSAHSSQQKAVSLHRLDRTYGARGLVATPGQTVECSAVLVSAHKRNSALTLQGKNEDHRPPHYCPRADTTQPCPTRSSRGGG